MRLQPIGSKANSHFRSQTTGAARGSARCSWPTSSAEPGASAQGIFSLTYCAPNERMKALARKNGFRMADVPRDGRLVRIVKDWALSRGAGSSGMVTAPNPAISAWSALSSRSGARSSIGRSKDNYCSSKQAIIRSMQSRQRKQPWPKTYIGSAS